MGYTPLNDLVLIDPEPPKSYEEFAGFTHVTVPDAYKHGPVDPPFWGKVIAKGPRCRDGQVTIGARVLYAKWGWAKLPLDAERHYALVREQDLLAVDEPK